MIVKLKPNFNRELSAILKRNEKRRLLMVSSRKNITNFGLLFGSKDFTIQTVVLKT